MQTRVVSFLWRWVDISHRAAQFTAELPASGIKKALLGQGSCSWEWAEPKPQPAFLVGYERVGVRQCDVLRCRLNSCSESGFSPCSVKCFTEVSISVSGELFPLCWLMITDSLSCVGKAAKIDLLVLFTPPQKTILRNACWRSSFSPQSS